MRCEILLSSPAGLWVLSILYSIPRSQVPSPKSRSQSLDNNDFDNDNPSASAGPPGPPRSGQTPATSAPPSGDDQNPSFRQVYFEKNS